MELYAHGTDDHTLFCQPQEELAVFLTTDKDFFHTVPLLYPERKAAVITLRQPSRVKILARLEAVLQGCDLQNSPSAILLVTDRNVIKRT